MHIKKRTPIFRSPVTSTRDLWIAEVAAPLTFFYALKNLSIDFHIMSSHTSQGFPIVLFATGSINAIPRINGNTSVIPRHERSLVSLYKDRKH